ncbi:MAG: 6-phosphofructokinase [Deltaproteobacteria bacterium]|nr:6-phosphofructokinase [Deltaproteobacteria bacterium]
MAKKTIGVLTGGGDCPGLNAAIRAVVRKALRADFNVVGVRRGWKGLMTKDVFPMDINSVSGILPKGGTILGTSRTNPYKDDDSVKTAHANFKEIGLHALVAIGGEDTLGAAAKLSRDGFPVIGVPKTIDGDLWGTDATIGFDTAANIATDAIDRLHTTAESHNRVMVVEIMGRHAGWLALQSGIAGGADIILIPEFPVQARDVADAVLKRHDRGKNFSIVVVSEGAKVEFADTGEAEEVLRSRELDEFGHVALGGIGERVATALRRLTKFDTRVTVLGHVQRGGAPTAWDRILATNLGVRAVELIEKGKSGRMSALVDGKFTDVPLEDVLGKLRLVPKEQYDIAQVFFG